MAVEVVQPDEEEVPVEVLAESIVKISEGVEKILAGPLKRRTILLLLRDHTGLGMSQIDTVLEALVDLREEYVK